MMEQRNEMLKEIRHGKSGKEKDPIMTVSKTVSAHAVLFVKKKSII